MIDDVQKQPNPGIVSDLRVATSDKYTADDSSASPILEYWLHVHFIFSKSAHSRKPITKPFRDLASVLQAASSHPIRRNKISGSDVRIFGDEGEMQAPGGQKNSDSKPNRKHQPQSCSHV